MEDRLKFAETLTDGLKSMLTTGKHADVTIVVDGTVFPCHKVVLCALSPYFEAMFTHDMVETRGGIVTLYDIDAATFDSLLTFMYSGDDVVRADNAEQIFKASSMLQIPCLQERCEEFLLNQVSHDNCVGIWHIAKTHNCEKLAAKSLETVMENFQHVSSCSEFRKLEIDEIMHIIENDDLLVPNEEIVCEAVMSWVKDDVTTRQKHLGKLLEGLRLPIVSSDYLFKFIDDEYFDIPLDSDVYLKEVLKYQSLPSRRHEFTSRRCTERINSQQNDVLVIVGGLLKSVPRFQTTKEVVCYSFQQKKWFYLPSLPNDQGYEFAVCVHGSDIYVSGGWLKLHGMTVYKGQRNKWKTCENMTNGRCGHAMVAMSDSIFVFGGRDGKAPAMTNIEEFSLRTKKWRNAGELLLGIRSMSTSVTGETVFIFGGITETDKDTDLVQCYDTRLGTSTIIGDFPFECRLTRTVTCDDVTYVILPDGRVVLCDRNASRKRITSLSEMSSISSETDNDSLLEVPTSNKEDAPLPSPTSPKAVTPIDTANKENIFGKVRGRLAGFNQHHFEAIQYRGNMLLAGGKTPDNTILKSIMVVNPVTSKFLEAIEMPTARWCFGCVRTVINKTYLNNAISLESVDV